MSWTDRIAMLAASVVICGCVQATTPGSHATCPAEAGNPLRYVDIYDGSPAQMALLQADVAKPDHGSWQLGYVYDAGRYVTVRCGYADKQTRDVKLAQRVAQCAYRVAKDKTLSLNCSR